MSKKQLIRRLFQILIVLVGISFFTFCLTYLAPGDPVRSMYAATGTMPSEEVLEQTREELGLNEPMLVQYWNWLSDCLHGDFGTSYSQHKPVAELLLDRLFPTVRLALLSLALMLAVFVGLLDGPLGFCRSIAFNALDFLTGWIDLIWRLLL